MSDNLDPEGVIAAIEKLNISDRLPIKLKKKNKCCIFSNRFEQKSDCEPKKDPALEPLLGHKYDEENIATTFSWLNFDVEIAIDLDKNDLMDRIKDLSADDYENSECLVLIFLSHGDCNDIIYTGDCKYVSMDSIVTKFTSSKSLHGKPKLFFFQACRGRKKMDAIECANIAAGNEKKLDKAAKKADTFIFYSTTKDNKSYLQTRGFFITTLCAVLRKYGGKRDLSDIVTIVNLALSRDVRHEDNDQFVQVSEVRHTLTCNLQFTPQKENYAEFEGEFKESNEYKEWKEECGWGNKVESNG